MGCKHIIIHCLCQWLFYNVKSRAIFRNYDNISANFISHFNGSINRGTFYQWETLIAIEYNHKMNYYKLVNMFTDVKVLNERTVRRKYLDLFLRTPSSKKFNENYMYKFLFIRSFARGKMHSLLY